MTTTFNTGCYESVGKLKISRNSKKTHIYYQRESASLYIGDLSFDVKENDILEIFSKMSGLLSVRICRDVISEKSLGYGYINFQSKKYAKRAMKKMNFYFDKNSFKKPLRLMWKEKDKTLRISGKGNIFVNHLPYDYKTIDLYKLFLPFGKIPSCKICYDSEGNSKRFGFVHFYLSKNAREAIRKLNESLLKGKKLHLSPFIKKETRDFLLPKNAQYHLFWKARSEYPWPWHAGQCCSNPPAGCDIYKGKSLWKDLEACHPGPELSGFLSAG